MAQTSDFIVIGKGMMGAAAAKHLARTGAKVILAGPDEPTHRQTHQGAFASHYDSGRITRTIDSNPDWALLAHRSIKRYRDIESESGIAFYNEVGCVIAAPSNAKGRYVERAIIARDRIGSNAEFLDQSGLKSRLPLLHFPPGFTGLYERNHAGYINPRALVEAQTQLAAMSGATICRAEIAALHDRQTHVEAVTAGGERLLAERAIVAVGGYAIRRELLAHPLDLTVKARTVLLVELSERERTNYAAMPSVIQAAGTDADSFYVLPPVQYPDGKHYIKIGGGPVDVFLETEQEINAWFQGDGNTAAALHMQRHLEKLLPDLQGRSQLVLPCITTYTRHGYPYIDFAGSERIIALTGGNGAAAKSSDEIGRLGSVLAMTGKIDGEGYKASFRIA